MIVQARQFKSFSSFNRYISRLNRCLSDRYCGFPLPGTTRAWLKRGGFPSAPNMVKVFMLILYPSAAFPLHGYDLAEYVAVLLEDRHQAFNDWACGFQANNTVCLFLKPWGTSMETHKRVWFRPDIQDMAVIRLLDSDYISNKQSRGYARYR